MLWEGSNLCRMHSTRRFILRLLRGMPSDSGNSRSCGRVQSFSNLVRFPADLKFLSVDRPCVQSEVAAAEVTSMELQQVIKDFGSFQIIHGEWP
jgi:hypothetical protein